MSSRRIERLNSLLREVLSDVIHKEVKNPALPSLITVTRVEITKDLRHGKVYISVIGDENAQKKALTVLRSAADFIAIQASKQVCMRFFPELQFILDNTLNQQIHIESLLSQIQKERTSRPSQEEFISDVQGE